MQELRSTEILDNEIRSEARRKAEAVLKRADEECEQILSGVDNRIEAAKIEKHEFYQKKLAAFEKDIAASAPLEKQRLSVSFVHSELVKALNKYLSALSEEERLGLVLKYCEPSVFAGREFNAYVYGFDIQKAQNELKDVLGIKPLSCTKTEFGRTIIEDDLGLEKNEGIILETPDKSMRCRLTLSQVFAGIMDKYRKQLSDALFEGAGESGGAK
ncbi:MAG: hypothetical protein J5726_09120 [Treponema sp.]|nr:hypothetical protein [Treponema sp.]